VTIASRELHAGWTVEALDGRVPAAVREAGAIPATVPGTVHTDLLAAGLIGDPYLDDNERVQGWIGSTSWRYATMFDWTDDGFNRIDLAFDGLDTVATVRLNGRVILSCSNQHRSYRVPVQDVLVAGANSLEIQFEAPIPAVDRASEQLGARPHANHHPYNALRKMASSFGWDWGIDTSTTGIWRAVRLESWSTARFDAIRAVPRVDGSDGVLAVTVDVDGEAVVRVSVGEISVTRPPGELTLRVPHVERWWPRGYGAPHRYPLLIELLDESGAILDSRTLQIGFRDVELQLTPDHEGTGMRFVVNGVPVWVRGVNWIPDDAFPHRVTRERYAARIAQAQFANVGLIRVWGGGIYESEDFYELCDELGMLTWQDFLFACAAYSEEEPLRSEVEAEAREAVARIGAHPSIVLFNGNNENLEGFEEWGWRDRLDGKTWGAGYYDELLPSIVAEYAPQVPYAPGSPFSPGRVSRPNDPAHGSVHIWDLWNERDWNDYREYRPRFVAEFGWQGPASWATLTRSIHDAPLTPESPGMQVHQKAVDGNAKLDVGLVRHAPVPDDMRAWHWAMQLNQARAVGTALEHFRSLAPFNMGAIVWQLNDCWPVTSWAAIDGDGREKPLLYALKHAFAPRLLTIQPRGEGLAAVLSNETNDPWAGNVVIERLDYDGTLLARQMSEIQVAVRGAVTLPLDVGEPNNRGRELVRAHLTDGSGAVTRGDWFYADYRDSLLSPAALTMTVRTTRGGAEVELTAGVLVRDLAIQADLLSSDAVAHDAIITLLPGESVTIAVDASEPLDLEALPGLVRTANELVAGRSIIGWADSDARARA
jgi:beta-mannosidase